MKKICFSFFVVALALGLVVCADDKALLGTWAWQDAPINDTRLVPAFPENYTLEFLENDIVNIQNACNSGSGTYSAHYPKMTLEQISMSEMGCSIHSLEKEFMAGLNAVRTYELSDDTLMLHLQDGSDMVFAPLLPPAGGTASLQGPVWAWQYTRLGALIVPEDFRVTFRKNGELSIKAACNSGSSTYSTQCNWIDIGWIVMTERACTALDVEEDFLRKLVLAERYELDGGMLRLHLGDGGEMLFAPSTNAD